MNRLISPALPEDLEAILALQKAAFASEAQRLNNFSIAPLTQDLPGLQGDYQRQTILKYTYEGRIIGSVRAFADETGTCHIGRLIVDPAFQNQGIATELMAAIEESFEICRAYEIFTDPTSPITVRLYEKLGYHIHEYRQMDVDMVIMRKANPPV